MINNNKILTVSYGTFSCTLEGFDDSFGTMKAIAEYFRDLSADDRYFGAEPIQPDAQMLARIAEREISRHVEARQDKGRIVLSAQGAQQPDALDAPAAPAVSSETPQEPAPLGTQETQAPSHPQAAPDEPQSASEVDATETTPEATAPAHPADIPDAEAQTRAAQATVQTDARADKAPDAKVDARAPALAAETERDIVPSLPDADVEAFFAESQRPALVPTGSDDFEDSGSDPLGDKVKSDSIADKLKRIRAVVSQQSAPTVDTDFVEDEHADTAPEAPCDASEAIDAPSADAAEQDATAQTNESDNAPAFDTDDESKADLSDEDAFHAVIAEAAQQDRDADIQTDSITAISEEQPATVADDTVESNEDHTEEDEDDVIASTLRDLEDALDEDDAIASNQSQPDVSPIDDEDADDDDISDILKRLEMESDDGPTHFEFDIPKSADASEEDDLEDDSAFEMDSLVAAPDMDDLDDLDDGNLFEPENDTQDADTAREQALPPARQTRVLKVKRASLEDAIQSGRLVQYDDEDEDDAAKTKPAPTSLRKAPLAERSSLSDEAEEELARELAALEADMLAEGPHSSDADLTDETAQAEDDIEEEMTSFDDDDSQENSENTTITAARHDLPNSAEEDFSRLMEETDSQMEEPESTTRRDAFAQLRAAVAAKKADEAVGGKRLDEDRDEAYRDDLASVVRPRRPVSGTRSRTERPAEQRPAPLKLVAEQRIDVDQPVSAAPVRPRRVAAVAAAPEPAQNPDVESFADFAADAGAADLPDLLEAAAAYLSFVEGHAEFSRPQLMTKVRQVEKENFTREDSLRLFGKLLRDGKIEKLKGGRFQVSEHIGYKPDARAAG